MIKEEFKKDRMSQLGSDEYRTLVGVLKARAQPSAWDKT
jgi:hypothetical protein